MPASHGCLSGPRAAGRRRCPDPMDARRTAMRNVLWRLVGMGGWVAAAALGGVAPASADTIVDEWGGIKAPPPPVLKPVTVDVPTTALLLLDFSGAQDASKGPCNDK